MVAGAKQRAEEGGAEPAALTAAEPSPAEAPAAETPAAAAAPVAEEAKATPASATSPATPTTIGQPDRTLMKRSTYAGVVDTGPIPGETPAQKIERLTKLAVAAKQKAEGG